MEEKTKFAQFVENFKEKKTTIIGIAGALMSLAILFAPQLFVNVEPGEVTEVVNEGWNLIEGILGLVVSILLIVSRMFPPKVK